MRSPAGPLSVAVTDQGVSEYLDDLVGSNLERLIIHLAGPEEALTALVDVVHMSMPADPVPLRAASTILGESSTEPRVIWKNPGGTRGCPDR